MSAILSDLRNTVIAGFVLALLFFLIFMGSQDYNFGGILGSVGFWSFFFRWAHVLSGVMWIGLLWYFNFVQIPNMPNIPDDQKPAIGKVIAPAALWWFRWGAMATLITGLVLAMLNGYLIESLTIGIADGFAVPKHIAIGLGMWLAIIMFINVWFVIWPNQKIALGIIDAPADAKPKAARTAMLFSRNNTMLSFPMFFGTRSAQHVY